MRLIRAGLVLAIAACLLADCAAAPSPYRFELVSVVQHSSPVDVSVRLTRAADGTPVDQTRTVIVTAGANVKVNFTSQP